MCFLRKTSNTNKPKPNTNWMIIPYTSCGSEKNKTKQKQKTKTKQKQNKTKTKPNQTKQTKPNQTKPKKQNRIYIHCSSTIYIWPAPFNSTTVEKFLTGLSELADYHSHNTVRGKLWSSVYSCALTVRISLGTSYESPLRWPVQIFLEDDKSRLWSPEVSKFWSWIYWGGDDHIRGSTARGRSVIMYASFSMSCPQNGIRWSRQGL